MLKTECERCGGWIPLSNEAKDAVCPGCSETVPVREVYISAGPFTISKEVLLRNIHKYKRLVIEAEKEALGLRKDEGARPDDISIRSIDLFVTNLKEMLDGCRRVARQRLEGARMEFRASGGPFRQCSVVNMSLEGACIDTGKDAEIGRLWNEMSLRLIRRGSPVLISGRVVWLAGKRLGIRFEGLGDAERRSLLEYICEKASPKEP